MFFKSKKLKFILAAVLIFLLGIGVGFWLGKIKYAMPDGRQTQNKNIVSVNGNEKTFIGDFKVARVIDGDTIEIEGGERVRYIGIDTPEMASEGKPEECGAEKALEKNRELVVGKTVELSKDVSERDKYGRLLRYVWVDGILVNTQLVRLGLAKTTSFPPDVRFLEEITTAQKEAQKNKAGLWSDCWQK